MFILDMQFCIRCSKKLQYTNEIIFESSKKFVYKCNDCCDLEYRFVIDKTYRRQWEILFFRKIFNTRYGDYSIVYILHFYDPILGYTNVSLTGPYIPKPIKIPYKKYKDCYSIINKIEKLRDLE
ncbi:MAG: hypothetical protein LC122_12140 [Chitinophagales bacterium]|nr:hypothetical protein [Chitinophagales bacterium]